MLINPHRFAAAPVVGPEDATFALVKRTTDIGTSPVPWDDEVTDAGNWHSTSADTSRITMPSTVTYARVIANGNITTGDQQFGMLKNGSLVRGGGASAGQVFQNIVSAPISVTTGDYFEVTFDATTLVANETTWFAVEKFDSTLKRALVYKSSTLALSAGVLTTPSFDSEVYDTDAFHDTGTNPSRLTVPSGVTLVRLTANMLLTADPGDQIVGLAIKNGAVFTGNFHKDTDGNFNDSLNFVSAILEVSTSDYFEFQVQSANAATLSNGEGTWFCIEEVPSSVKRCLAIRSANQSLTANTPVAVIYDGADVYDTDSIHDPASNNTRFTVPSGCTEARMSFNLVGPSSSATWTVGVRKNGSAYHGGGQYRNATSASDALNGMSSWISVTPGDYFEIWVTASTNATLGAGNNIWACFEGR